MKQPTHFIEVYKGLSTGKIHNGSINLIEFLSEYLKYTDRCSNLKTIAIWKIYPKPQPSVFVAHYDNDLKATIIQ